MCIAEQYRSVTNKFRSTTCFVYATHRILFASKRSLQFVTVQSPHVTFTFRHFFVSTLLEHPEIQSRPSSYFMSFIKVVSIHTWTNHFLQSIYLLCMIPGIPNSTGLPLVSKYCWRVHYVQLAVTIVPYTAACSWSYFISLFFMIFFGLFTKMFWRPVKTLGNLLKPTISNALSLTVSISIDQNACFP